MQPTGFRVYRQLEHPDRASLDAHEESNDIMLIGTGGTYDPRVIALLDHHTTTARAQTAPGSAHALDRVLDAADRIRPHARAVVQHAVDSGEADAGLAGNVPQRQRRRRFLAHA